MILSDVHPRFLLSCIVLLFVSIATAQSASDQEGPRSAATPTFRSSSRLVQLDVVVLDASGHSVVGLKKSDFEVREDGKPQQLQSFDVHEARQSSAAKPEPFHLPPHQYTNVPEEEQSGPLTVILFDTLNTPPADQVMARQHMLEFLKSLPSGQSTALFALGSHLRMIQSFTGKSDLLLAAASSLTAGPAPLLVTNAERQRDEDNLVYRERMIAPAGGGPVNISSAVATSLSQATQKLRDALARQEQATLSDRVSLTIESLAELASMLRGYPGRKNLLWLSGAFPFSFGPNALLRSELRDNTSFNGAIHQATTLLSAAQVAVYPIDVGGVRTRGVDITSTGEGASGVNTTNGLTRLNTTFAQQLQEQSDARATMDELAEQTGGKAYYGTNDLKTAMQRSLDQGSSYYTLSYVPQNQAWNGKFRRIDLKLERPGHRLQYRRGYYALPEPTHSPDDSTRKLATALRPDIPDSTALYMKAEVLPPDGRRNSVQITYLINAQQITFTDTPDGRKHAFVDLLAVVLDKNGKDIGHAADTVDATLDMNQYAKILRAGMQARQQIPTQPGAYRVRLGAVDRLSQQVGTIDVPLQDTNRAAR